jgi:exosome complex exonuclease DIS3/RRP44
MMLWTLCASVREYVEGLKNSSAALLDLLAATGSAADADLPTGKKGPRKAVYSEYINSATLLSGIKSEHLHKGHFNANPYNYLEGTVSSPSYPKPILLVGRENMNRSVNGDVVVVEILPEDEWKAPGESVVDQDGSFISLYSLALPVQPRGLIVFVFSGHPSCSQG